MRKESSNQFTEGLICDLNPINTPNTVLTDALNATIITYDGNEYSLQNDRGNYPLENCKLKPNYIPVGLKEYGDILYIVSYNPLNNHVEIGSYPSPVEIETSKYNDTNLEVDSVIGQINGEMNYSELVEKCKTVIWTSDNEEDSKLYPGDEYCINEHDPSPYKYETLEYLIIDDNRKEYNVSDLIKLDGEFHPISWQIPGWLATRYRLGTFDNFIMSIRSAVVPVINYNDILDECKINLNFQFRISDKLFLPSLNNSEYNIKTDLGIDLVVKNNSEELFRKTLPLTKGKFIDWYSDSKILWLDDNLILSQLPDDSLIEIEATPVINITSGGTTRKLIYDGFSESISFSLKSIGSPSDFNIGGSIWKFYIDKDDPDNLYIEYDITGPIVTNSEVQLYYRALDLSRTPVCNWIPVENYSGVTNHGFGILEFKSNFEAEGIYILEFTFNRPNATNEVLQTIDDTLIFKKLVIASRLFYDFVGEHDKFDEINFDTWINKAISTKIECTIDSESMVDDSAIDYSNYSWNEEGDLVNNKGTAVLSGNLKKLWNNKYAQPDKGWTRKDSIEALKTSGVEFVVGRSASAHVKVEFDTTSLSGKLWEGAPQLSVSVQPYASEISTTDIKTINRNELTSLESSINTVSGKRKFFDYNILPETTSLDGIRQIKEIPLMWLYTERIRKGLNNQSYSTLYCGGNMSIEGEDLIANKPTSYSSYSEFVNRSSITIPNSISKAILQTLGNNDIGLLGLAFNLHTEDDNKGKYKLQHGENKTVVEQKDGENLWIFTYLVVRNNLQNKNYAVLIPLSDGGDFWRIKVGSESENINATNWWNTKLPDGFVDNLANRLEPILKNLFICDSKNALQIGSYTTINTDNAWENVPLGKVFIKSNKSNIWKYDGFNLLSRSDRNKIISLFTQDFCGKLLNGNTTSLEEHEICSEDIQETYSLNISEQLDNIDRQISIINNLIPEQNVNQPLIQQIERRSTTKGVYWLGDPNEHKSLINALNDDYAYSDSSVLTIGKAPSSQLYTEAGDDHDKLYIGWVTNDITAEIK